MDRSSAPSPAPQSDPNRLAKLHPSWSSHPLASWLVDHGGRERTLAPFLQGLCEQLTQSGIPLLRVALGVRSMHPEVYARAVTWMRGQAGIEEIDRFISEEFADGYKVSPVRPIHEGAGAIRRRLDQPGAPRDFPILDELAALGCTDYVIMPILHTTGQINYLSWTTDRPGGFETPELTLLYDLLPLIALRVELIAAYDATRTLLETYLGRESARRVLAGSIRRAHVESLRAAILFSDLRGFTRLADRNPPDQVIALLDEYFELMARPIEDRGGQVLKFLGDGVLAIFLAGTDPTGAAARALAAAREALDSLRPHNQGRAEIGAPAIECGISLHLGDVQYGNIGARDRLDFTAIGPAVNEVARLDALCKTLRRPLLASARFVAALDKAHRLESVGFHGLRGVAEPQEVFGLADTGRER